MTTLASHRDQDALHLTLRRPAARNALDPALVQALTAVFQRLPAGIRRVVLRGDGPVFCAGADLAWMARGAQDGEGPEHLLPPLLEAIDHAEVVVIALVHGAAMGGGIGLLACCDAVVADQATQFGLVEARLGLVPAIIAPAVVGRMGASWARYYFTTGQVFGAAEAHRLGLVHHVAADPAAAEALVAGAWADSIARCGPRAIAEAKAVVRDVVGVPDGAVRERLAGRLARLRAGDEAQEGIRALRERRAPRWP